MIRSPLARGVVIVAALLFTLFGSIQSISAIEMTDVWINEFHYDNTGGDVGEFVEIAGRAGTVLDGLSLVLYNGLNGKAYGTKTNLGGTLANQSNGFGFMSYSIGGIQNGGPDGIALIFTDETDPNNLIVSLFQFLSYEGSFTATNGPITGITSTDIGKDENSPVPQEGNSLQLTGTGSKYSDFTWAIPADDTPEAANIGQTFASVPDNISTIILLFTSIGTLVTAVRRKR